MDKLVVTGGRPLRGIIAIRGSKNAALPLLCTALLTDEAVTLHNVPPLSDIRTMQKVIEGLGAHCTLQGESLTLQVPNIEATLAPYDLMRTMRAGVLVLGALLARCGTARVSLPGGCAIGSRPVDLHIKALQAMGAEITITDGYINAVAPKGLQGTRIVFPHVSVGATENILMAATLAHGETIIDNAALEPEITDLAHCLQAMGAKISGVGTRCLVVQGQPRLHGAQHTVLADRVELGSYAMAVAATNGDAVLSGATTALLPYVTDVLHAAGVLCEDTPQGVRVRRHAPYITAVDVLTAPYPGFPTDLQAQFSALMAIARGSSTIHETIFENRFMHVPELVRMGANISITGNRAVVTGVEQLKGAPVMATDLRASFSLIIAALVADGTSEIRRLYHLDRGYAQVDTTLQALGADVQRVADKK
jgi:UDP-N-acetylglucosamine 1-carboxyvinyltransferase